MGEKKQVLRPSLDVERLLTLFYFLPCLKESFMVYFSQLGLFLQDWIRTLHVKSIIMMKKGVFIVLGLVVCFAAYILYSKAEKKKQPSEKEIPLQISKNSATFNTAVDQVLQQYYRLHDQLVEWDSAASIRLSADSLAKLTQRIPFKELKADSILVQTAQDFAGSLVKECTAMQADTAIVAQRRSFYNLSENLFNLLRTVQYDKTTIYHVKCPMAFNGDEEGFWLSDKREIVNPYYGKKDPTYHSGMLHCGSIEDSVSFNQQ